MAATEAFGFVDWLIMLGLPAFIEAVWDVKHDHTELAKIFGTDAADALNVYLLLLVTGARLLFINWLCQVWASSIGAGWMTAVGSGWGEVPSCGRSYAFWPWSKPLVGDSLSELVGFGAVGFLVIKCMMPVDVLEQRDMLQQTCVLVLASRMWFEGTLCRGWSEINGNVLVLGWLCCPPAVGVVWFAGRDRQLLVLKIGGALMLVIAPGLLMLMCSHLRSCCWNGCSCFWNPAPVLMMRKRFPASYSGLNNHCWSCCVVLNRSWLFAAKAPFLGRMVLDLVLVPFLLFNAAAELPTDSYYVRMLSLMNISVLLAVLVWNNVVCCCCNYIATLDSAGFQFNFEYVLGFPVGMELGPHSAGILDELLILVIWPLALLDGEKGIFGGARSISWASAGLLCSVCSCWPRRLLDVVPGVGRLIAEPGANGFLMCTGRLAVAGSVTLWKLCLITELPDS
ncbi:hypothetical protein Nepgr_023018 [Nepenthes gracilis]|uniref:Uncharacterized protein n=1 Tax=Nepenthes gracilis TaxID=150966 RepID=A0AAD3T1Z5_NEPGR|nr:hypothetical protein Nepgr_023018 [Nepenthes gracilis]